MANESYKRWHKPKREITNLNGNLKKGQTHQGYYNVKNKEKYIGDPNLVIYRSGWEWSFCAWADASPSVLRWSSEPVKVPYLDRISKLEENIKMGLDPNNPRNWAKKNYNTDFWIEIDKGGDKPEKWFIEVKPKKDLKKPEPIPANAPLKEIKKYNARMKTYIINEAKFKALTEWARINNTHFYIFHEETLMKFGIIGGKFDYKYNKERNRHQKLKNKE